MIAAALPPDPPPFYWRAPDRDPYRGTPDAAVLLLVEHGVPLTVVREQFREFRAAECHVRDIRQGERIALMLFGRGRVLRNVVAEPDRWPVGLSRRIVECDVDRGDWRFGLLRPEVCGNWSEEIVPLPGAPHSAVWGAPFAPPPGFAHWGGTFGGNAGAVGGFGGGMGFGAFAGGWSAGAPGLVLPRGLASGPREISFVLPERPRPTATFRVRHGFRRAAYERFHAGLHSAVFYRRPAVLPVVIVEIIPPSAGPGAPPSIPPSNVPEPASACLFAGALAMLALIRRIRRGRQR